MSTPTAEELRGEALVLRDSPDGAIRYLAQRLADALAEVERLRDAYQRTCTGMGFPECDGILAQGEPSPPEWAHMLRQRAEASEARLLETLRVADEQRRELTTSENRLNEVKDALFDWCGVAGWLDHEQFYGIGLLEMISFMRSIHCDERSWNDLQASGGLPEAQAARLAAKQQDQCEAIRKIVYFALWHERCAHESHTHSESLSMEVVSHWRAEETAWAEVVRLLRGELERIENGNG